MAQSAEEVGPRRDELEVSVFGPGVGECILVHLGEADWIVVDSCRHGSTRRPAALEYLERLGIDAQVAIKAIVITHWHDDHIGGIAEVVRHAPDAKVYCSSALNRDEFFTVIEAGRDAQAAEVSNVDEFASLFGLLQGRTVGERRESIGPEWVGEGSIVFRRPGTGGSVGCEVLALSPSSATHTLALHDLASVLPTAGTPKRRAVSLGPNESAVVLWIEAGGSRVLLGADLEASSGASTGWQAVVSAPSRPPGQAAIFKVAHHGSRNADEPQVWTTLLEPEPFAFLTPFARSGLPSPGDLRRLLGRTPHVFCTAESRGPRPPRRERAVDKTAGEVARNRRIVRGSRNAGHIRYRAPLSGSRGSVMLAGSAFQARA